MIRYFWLPSVDLLRRYFQKTWLHLISIIKSCMNLFRVGLIIWSKFGSNYLHSTYLQTKQVVLEFFWPVLNNFNEFKYKVSKGPSLYYVNYIFGFLWPTNYVSINTELNASKNGHFPNPPTQSFSWHNIGMNPKSKSCKECKTHFELSRFFDYI